VAQATVLNIGKSNSNPVDADLVARKLKFAAAFQGMDGDLTDLLVMARLVALCIETRLSGTRDNIETDEDGDKCMIIRMDDADMISFASLELCDRIKSIHKAYQEVFSTSEN
jgi:hypothetical protein